MRGVMV